MCVLENNGVVVIKDVCMRECSGWVSVVLRVGVCVCEREWLCLSLHACTLERHGKAHTVDRKRPALPTANTTATGSTSLIQQRSTAGLNYSNLCSPISSLLLGQEL